mgnify:CR=1 FL=1
MDLLVLMPLVMMAFFKPLARLALNQSDPTANGSEYTVPAMTTMFAFFLVGFIYKTAVEFLVTKQWFVRYLDLKQEFLDRGATH